MVEFAGWSLPLAYGSQIDEHHAVRRAAGAFDVSHMTIVDIAGSGAEAYLRRLLANDVAKLRAGDEETCRALYSCMLREDGGILDDLIAYRMGDDAYRLIVNAATRDKDLAWLHEQVQDLEVELFERTNLAMIAVQGPKARNAVAHAVQRGGELLALGPFRARRLDEYFVARTGYTGEDGFEIIIAEDWAPSLWEALETRGVVPCGLGARDTLRLEAGLNLYGADMDESVTPLECGLEWTVARQEDRAFIGCDALEARLAAGVAVRQTGLVLEGKGVLRGGYPVRTGAGDGVITSGTFSPTMGRSIALARVPAGASGECEVRIRGRTHRAQMVDPPFVRHGEIKIGLKALGP